MDNAELNFILKMRDEASAVIKSHAGAIRELGAAHGDLKGHAKEAESSLASLVNKAKEAAEAVSAIWAASEVFEKTIGAFGDLEVSLVRLRQSTNETKANMIELQEGIEKIAGNSLNQTNEQIASVAISASQLGVKGVEGILAFTTIVSQMATISGQSAGSVAAATAKIIGSTGEGEEGVAKFGAAFAALQAHTRGGGAALLQTAQQISMSTQQYEISGVKILGVAAALDNLGGRARSGGMAFTQTLSVMTKAVEENSYKLQDLSRSTGMTADEFKAMLATDPTAVFVKMLEAVNRLQKGGGDVHAFLKEFGLDNNLLSTTILAAAKNVDKFKDSINSAENADPGKLGKDAQEMFNTVEGSIHAASQAAKNFGEALGMAIAPAFVQTMGVATQVVKALGEAFHDLPAGGQAAVAGLAVIIPVIIAIRTAYRFLMEVVESGIGQYRNMSGIMGVVTKSAQFLRAAEEEVAVAHGHAATAAIAHGEAELKAADAVAVHTAALVKEGGAALTTAAEIKTFTASVEMANVALVSNARAFGVAAVEMELFGAKSAALGTTTAAAVASQSSVFSKIGVGIGRLMGFGIGFTIGSAIGDFVGRAITNVVNEDFPRVARAMAEWRETTVLGNAIKWVGNEMGLKTPAQKDEEAASKKKEHEKTSGETGEHASEATRHSSEHLDALTAERTAYNGLISSGRELIKSYDAVTEKTQKLDVAQKQLNALAPVPESQRPAEMDDKHLAALQRALDIARENLDPMNKVLISLREQVASSEAVTKADQNRLEIANKLRELTSSDPNFDKGKADAVTGLMQIKQQNDIKKAFDEQIKGTRESIQMSGALTATEKSRLEIELKIADAQKKQGYTPEQLASLKQALTLEQQIKDSVEQMDALNPQAKALRGYDEQNKRLQGRLDRGEITPGEKKNEQAKLDADTLGARDPIGKIVDDQKTELAQLKVIGEYKEAELKTMGQIDALTKSGLTVTKETENALREYNKAVQDQKQAQSSGFEGWANKVGDMKTQLQGLESSFADGLSTAITGALSGKKGNFSALAQNIGGQMIKLGVDQVLKQGIQASGISNLFGLGSGEAGAKAKAASDALAAAGAKQVAGAGANADAMAKQLTTASMAVTATTVNINGAVAGAAPGMPGGNQAGLPGTGGASMPGGAGTSTPQQVDIASVGGTALTTPTIPFSAPGQIAAGGASMSSALPAITGLGAMGIGLRGAGVSASSSVSATPSLTAFDLFKQSKAASNDNLFGDLSGAKKAFAEQGLGNPFQNGVPSLGSNPGMGGFGAEAFGKLPSSGGASNVAQLIARKEAFLGTARMDVNAQRLGYGSDTITDQTGSIRRVKAWRHGV